MNQITEGLLELALAGDVRAQNELVSKLRPVIQWRVAAMLRRWRTGTASGRDLRQEVEDVVQAVFLTLFDKDADILRSWDPDIGPLEALVGHIASIRTAEICRSRLSPWREEPTAGEDLPDPGRHDTPEDHALSRNELLVILFCLRSRFTPRDIQLFDLTFLQQLSPPEVAEKAKSGLDAIYKWRSRLRQWARDCRSKAQSRKNLKGIPS